MNTEYNKIKKEEEYENENCFFTSTLLVFSNIIMG